MKRLNRRSFLSLGTATALTGFSGGAWAVGQAPAGVPGFKTPHTVPHAKRMIQLIMGGGPPQFETFDYKPELVKYFNKDLPESVRGNQVLTGMTAGQARLPVAPSLFKFAQHGQSGAWVSDLFPWTAKIADELTIVKSMHTDAINHEPGILLFNTGRMFFGKASLGAWLNYALGPINNELPAYIVLMSKSSWLKNVQAFSNRLWSAGFLPSEYSGVALRSGRQAILHLQDVPGVSRSTRRAMLDAVQKFNTRRLEEMGQPDIAVRVAQYEMAYRMQQSVPNLVDLRDEPASTWELYGPAAREPGTFAYNCLIARRLAERGVRMTQIFHRSWDHHSFLPEGMRACASDVDRGCYALIADLKRRGLLEDTVVTWGGEFGRTVYSQGTLTATDYGRDHHPRCFSIWMAGGGFKPGISYGRTDEFSYNIVENPVHVRDFHATVLNRFGFDHQRLTFKAQGLDERLTGVMPAKVIDALCV
jgi:hypothetical protein